MESDQNFRTEADLVNFPAAQPVLQRRKQRVTLATTHILTSMGHPTFFLYQSPTNFALILMSTSNFMSDYTIQVSHDKITYHHLNISILFYCACTGLVKRIWSKVAVNHWIVIAQAVNCCLLP